MQLFMSVCVEHAGIDYHVVLAQNALQQCLEVGELHDELVSALARQTAPHTHSKHGVQVTPPARRHAKARLKNVSRRSPRSPDAAGVARVLHPARSGLRVERS